jgi:hypothetical protein
MTWSIINVIHCSTCILVICYCYLVIYQLYRKTGRSRHSTTNKPDIMLQSYRFNSDIRKKEEDNEFRVLLTTVILIGWTLVGN